MRDFGTVVFAALVEAAQAAYQWEVVDTEMEILLIGPGKEYADSADWREERITEWIEEAIDKLERRKEP
jgi:hypothetical protein